MRTLLAFILLALVGAYLAAPVVKSASTARTTLLRVK